MAEIVIMPKLGFDMAEGTLVRWLISEDENVEKGQVLAEIETDKATVEVESNFSGIVRRHLVEEGTIVPVSTPIAVIGEPGETIDFEQLVGEGVEVGFPGEKETPIQITGVSPTKPPVEEGLSVSEEEHLPHGVLASPLARRMAEELGIDLRDVKGSGPRGRVVKVDIESYKAAPKIGVKPSESLLPIVSSEVPADRYVPLSKLRSAIGKRMVNSKQQFPQFFVTHEYDMNSLMALRAQVNSILSPEGKASVNDYIIRAVALALREFPNLNAKLDEESQAVVQLGHINIGVAVAVEDGLLTVVCHDADLKSIRQISQEVAAKASRAREGKVRSEDIEGSTFSVSNMGMFEVEEFIAIINPPEAAILAIGSVLQIPVVEEGEIVVGWRMKATISVDHRVSDGAEAARFLQALEKYLEEPLRLMV